MTISPRRSLRGEILTKSVEEDYLDRGFAFSSITDMAVAASGGTLEYIFDASAFTGGRILFPPILIDPTAGPVLVRYYIGTVETGDGTPAVMFNRNGKASNTTPQSTIKTDPTTVSNDGFNYISLTVPGEKKIAGDSAGGRAVIIEPSLKYMLRMTNQANTESIITVDATWYEIARGF